MGPTPTPSWYDVLGVPPTATDDELRTAHRVASKAAHPDAGGSTARFQLIQTAYEVLRDPVARAEHDRDLRGEPLPPSRTTSVAPSRAGLSVRPASAPTTPPAPSEVGCLTPWVLVAGGVALVVALLVAIATFSLSSSGPSDEAGPASSSAPDPAAAPSPAAPAPAPGGGPSASTPGSSPPRTGLSPVTTVVLSDLPAGFPRGHVPMPAGSQLSDVVSAGSDRGQATYTIHAMSRSQGTDPERAAVNYASSLQAAGWTVVPDDDPDAALDGTAQRTFADSDGSVLRFSVLESAGGVEYIIGYHAGAR